MKREFWSISSRAAGATPAPALIIFIGSPGMSNQNLGSRKSEIGKTEVRAEKEESGIRKSAIGSANLVRDLGINKMTQADGLFI